MKLPKINNNKIVPPSCSTFLLNNTPMLVKNYNGGDNYYDKLPKIHRKARLDSNISNIKNSKNLNFVKIKKPIFKIESQKINNKNNLANSLDSARNNIKQKNFNNKNNNELYNNNNSKIYPEAKENYNSLNNLNNKEEDKTIKEYDDNNSIFDIKRTVNSNYTNKIKQHKFENQIIQDIIAMADVDKIDYVLNLELIEDCKLSEIDKIGW